MKELINNIIAGDCIEILNNTKEPFADLIFADPPFNIGYKYDKYHDKKKSDQYLSWTKDWIAACYNVLKPNGSFYIAIGDDYAAQIKLIAENLGLHMRNWIIWHYTFGQQTKNKFARAHTHIFYFVKDKDNFTFNEHAVHSPSDRQLIYNDKRANAIGKMPDDVWNCFSRVCGTFKERLGWHPCQMPELLLARIIASSSNKNDCVLDPFNGSGTTTNTAVIYERNYSGIDISDDYVKNAKIRIAETKKMIKKSPSLFFTNFELIEMKRLFVEMGIGFDELAASEKIMNIFAKQFALRMSNKKKYNPAEMIPEIKGFYTCGKKK